jgi:hypothetical protein
MVKREVVDVETFEGEKIKLVMSSIKYGEAMDIYEQYKDNQMEQSRQMLLKSIKECPFPVTIENLRNKFDLPTAIRLMKVASDLNKVEEKTEKNSGGQ